MNLSVYKLGEKFYHNVLNTGYESCLPCRVNNVLQFFPESASVSTLNVYMTALSEKLGQIDSLPLGLHKLLKTCIAADFAIGNKQGGIWEQEYVTQSENHGK